MRGLLWTDTMLGWESAVEPGGQRAMSRFTKGEIVTQGGQAVSCRNMQR